MKLKNLFMGILAAVAFTACSSDKLQDEPKLPEEELNSRFMSVTIRNSDGATSRADDVFEDGDEAESTVQSIRFYFFKEDGTPRKVAYTGKNYFDCDAGIVEDEDADKDNPNVEKVLKAIIVLTSDDDKENWSDLKAMVAVANHKDDKGDSFLPEANQSLEDLNKLVSDYSSTGKGRFVMTNSVFGADKFGCATEVIEKQHIRPTRTEAEENPVNIYVERVVAKVRVGFEWKGMEVKDKVSYDGKEWCAVLLKDGSGEDITDSKGSRIYAMFRTWGLSGDTDRTYLFKQVDNAWTFEKNWKWNDPEKNRSYWAMNPNEVEIRRHNNNQASVIGKDDIYCMENAADYPDPSSGLPRGYKSSYNPDKQVGNRTQVYLPALLVSIDGTDKVTPVDLAIWGDVKYTKDDLKKAMLASVTDNLYKQGATEDDRVSLDLDDVVLVTAEEAGMADDKTENSRRYLSYIQIKDVGLEGKLYEKELEDNETKFKPISIAKANEILTAMPGARCWNGGDTYYYVDINHLNAVKDADEQGKYGVVRNHIYDIKLNSVLGLGTPVLDPDKIVIPQKPSNEAFYIGARLNILSWRVVNQGVKLEW